jgi:CheY-like chemotaxis protein
VDETTTFLIVALAVLLCVGLVGGVAEFSRDKITINTPGLLSQLRKASETKGIDQMQATAPEVTRAVRKHRRELPIATILWADDHPLNNSYERRAFANLGISCDTVTTNADAMASLGLLDYDVVISDYKRDGTAETGADLLRQLRESGNTMPFIFYTMGVNDNVRNQARTQGAADIVETPDQLLLAVTNNLPAR